MIPILYDANETEFENMGLGPLADATDCKVVEERNGSYELTLKYPKNGQHYADIEVNRIILAIPSPYRDAQPFRIYKVSKPMRGVITVNAQHISYDLSGVTVRPFSANSVADVLRGIKTNSVNANGFTFSGNSTATATCNYTTPNSARQILGGMEGSLIDRFGGEYEFDRFNVRWSLQRGVDSGVTIRYGKNLLSVSQDVDASGIVTGVVPYWMDYDGTGVVYGSRIDLAGESSVTRVIPLDLSNYYETQPTVQQLNERAQTYIKDNYTLEPSISCEVSFAIIEQSEEYKEFRLLEKCDLCDTLTVNYPDLGINSTAKIVKIETDVLKNKYTKVTIGSLRASVAQTIVAQQKQMEETPTKSSIGSLIGTSLNSILGANGGSVRLLDTNGDGEMDTLYIADDPDPASAKKVWRFNYLGWAASSNGYNGPFKLGATLEDGLLADFVTAANLVAGTIKSADDGKTFFLDLDSGVLRMNASQFSIGGSTIDSYVDSAVDSATSGFESRLSKAESSLSVQAGQIAGKVSQSDFNALGQRVSSAESSIQANANAIELRVTKSDVNGVVSSAIEQSASSIRLQASAISWESSKSTMTSEGVFESRSTWDDPNWLRIENGEIFGGQGGTQYAVIDMSSVTPSGEHGMTLWGDQIYADTKYLHCTGTLDVDEGIITPGTITSNGQISGDSLNISDKVYAGGDIECYGDFINGNNRGYSGIIYSGDNFEVLGGIIIGKR